MVFVFVFVFVLAHEQAISAEVPGHHLKQLTIILTVKSQQKRIELVTRPVHDQTPHLRENEACPVGDLVAEDVLELLVRAESEFREHRPSGGEESHQLLLKGQHFVFHGPKVALQITTIQFY